MVKEKKFRAKLRTYLLQNSSRLQTEHRINELKKAKIILSLRSDTKTISVTPVPVELNKFKLQLRAVQSFFHLVLQHPYMDI